MDSKRFEKEQKWVVIDLRLDQTLNIAFFATFYENHLFCR